MRTHILALLLLSVLTLEAEDEAHFLKPAPPKPQADGVPCANCNAVISRGALLLATINPEVPASPLELSASMDSASASLSLKDVDWPPRPWPEGMHGVGS